jgi:hypothetical protein
MNLGKLTVLSVTGPQSLTLSWDDGFTARINFESIFASRKSLTALSNPDSFSAAKLSDDGWSVEWPQGIDFGAPQLRRWADEQAGESMSANTFRAWIDGHDFTLDQAAAALGLSRRTIAYYLSGELVIPKTVMLATEGFDGRMAA